MKNILSEVNSPEDVKKLSYEQKKTLCSDIRNFLIDSVSETGGHLASNLGVVELTVALHTVFEVPPDKIIWDVGHQSYVHKILTGRKDRFSALRKFNGLSGFPKTAESASDCFNTGHSSTSISAALGMARARDLKKENYNVIAVLGDGASTGGMVWEALNDAGHSKSKLIIILNDNHMSISKNVGAISRYLRNIRINPSYRKSKMLAEKLIVNIPGIGKAAAASIREIKKLLRFIIFRTTLFEDLGFYYAGPVDGHNLSALIHTLEQAKMERKSVLIHICTKKGKGYPFAESDPSRFHGLRAFNRTTGASSSPAPEDYSCIFGRTITSLAEENGNIVAITAAMPINTGLSEFAARFPNRFFDVGIAEQHGVTLAAGFAAAGMMPVIPLYSTFMQRAYDQILHDVCLQNLHVVFPIDRAGIVGSDGETHQGVYDISFLSHMPNMTILSPASFGQLTTMLDFAVNRCTGPVAIRYPRGGTQANVPDSFDFPHCQVLKKGSGVCIFATGRMVKTAQEVLEALSDIDCELVAVPVISPIDKAGIVASAIKAKLVITIEDNVIDGGMGHSVAAVLAEADVHVRMKYFAFPREPIVHGSIAQLDKYYGVDKDSVLNYIRTSI